MTSLIGRTNQRRTAHNIRINTQKKVILDCKQNKKELKKYKFSVNILLVICCFLALILLIGFVALNTSTLAFAEPQNSSSNLNNQIDNESQVQEVIVRDGETLWDIAMNYLPDNTDPRAYITKIREYNDFDSSHIQPGQKINIPGETTK